MYINCFIKKIVILESQIVNICDYHRGRYWALNCIPKQSNVNALNNLQRGEISREGNSMVCV